MSTQVDYTPLTGGLDLVSGALNVKPGRMSECLNFEQVFGKQGYRRIDGYERFDGQDEPHTAGYAVLSFSTGVLAIVAGNTVTGTSANATVLSVELQSGTWGAGNAAGRLIVTVPNGVFAANELLTVGGVTAATAVADADLGSVSEANNTAYLVLAREARRTLIQKVPGSGPVLGVAVYQGDVYAARNAADGLSAVFYRSSITGWDVVKTGLLPGGTFSFTVANFTGTSTTLSLYGCDGRNSPFEWNGTLFKQFTPVFGSNATSTSSLAIAVGAKAFTVVEPARSWEVGDTLVAYSAANGGNQMTGTVASYAGSALSLTVTSIKGSGTFADWQLALANYSDRPTLVAAHRDHLFLAYPLGQLQISNVGDPLTYTTTASLIGLGDEITGLAPMKGSILGVFCLNRISLLSGTNSLDWQMESYSQSAGAKRGTTQETSGNALFLDDRGLTTLQSSQNFGDFEPAIFSRDIKPLLDQYTPSVVTSRIAKGKFQYRMYTDTGIVLAAAILTPETVVRPGDVAFSRWQYDHIPTCAGQGDMDDGSDGLFFGTKDGYVMREDVGTSFDGAPIDAVLRLHFNHLKSPSNKKRFRKLDLELEVDNTVTVSFRQQFDYADGQYQSSVTNQAIANGGGGQWDASAWDAFYWSLPIVTQAQANIDGVGKNMGLLLWHTSSTDQPFTLQGLLLQYTILGLAR